MSSRLPFALGEDRLRLLYRLPLSGAENSILVLNAAGTSSGRLFSNDVRFVTRDSGQLVGAESSAASAFDAVLLPGTLTSPASASSGMTARRLIALAHSALKPGGVLVGHLDHVLAPRNVLAWTVGKQALKRAQAWRGFETARRCVNSLHTVGFNDAECYYVEPNIGDPMALISSDVHAASTHFVRTVRRNRPLYSPVGYLVRASLAQAGLGGLLQSHLFLWARKPC